MSTAFLPVPSVMPLVDFLFRDQNLPFGDALRELARLRSEYGVDDVPLPMHLAPVADLLHRKGYSDHAIRKAIDDIASTGTAQITAWLDDDDRDEVEAILPGNPWLWDSSADNGYWTADAWAICG